MSDVQTATVTVQTTAANPAPDTDWAQPVQEVEVRRPSRLERAHTLAQRGMVTAEYAVGILAAIAVALVLVRVFNDNSFFKTLLQQVTKLIGQLSSSIK